MKKIKEIKKLRLMNQTKILLPNFQMIIKKKTKKSQQ